MFLPSGVITLSAATLRASQRSGDAIDLFAMIESIVATRRSSLPVILREAAFTDRLGRPMRDPATPNSWMSSRRLVRRRWSEGGETSMLKRGSGRSEPSLHSLRFSAAQFYMVPLRAKAGAYY